MPAAVSASTVGGAWRSRSRTVPAAEAGRSASSQLPRRADQAGRLRWRARRAHAGRASLGGSSGDQPQRRWRVRIQYRLECLPPVPHPSRFASRGSGVRIPSAPPPGYRGTPAGRLTCGDAASRGASVRGFIVSLHEPHGPAGGASPSVVDDRPNLPMLRRGSAQPRRQPRSGLDATWRALVAQPDVINDQDRQT
jgi:hypothetical protein